MLALILIDAWCAAAVPDPISVAFAATMESELPDMEELVEAIKALSDSEDSMNRPKVADVPQHCQRQQDLLHIQTAKEEDPNIPYGNSSTKRFAAATATLSNVSVQRLDKRRLDGSPVV